MNLGNVIINKLKGKNGYSLVGILIAAMALSVLAFPFTRWSISLMQTIDASETRLNRLGERLEMQSLIQDYWQQINSAPYDEFQDTIKTKGKTWTEDVAGKYTLNIAFGDEGKYENSLCDISKTPIGDDRSCRKAIITLTSKADPLMVETANTTKIATIGGGDSLPVGTILPYTGVVKDIPKKWRICDGTNGTPNLTGRFLEGVSSISDVKLFHSAGLPNITGSFRATTANAGTIGWGAFHWDGWYQYVASYSSGNPGSVYSFDASRVSSIYRNDITTVQPASYTVVYIVKVEK